jgi:hypothetical protein
MTIFVMTMVMWLTIYIGQYLIWFPAGCHNQGEADER